MTSEKKKDTQPWLLVESDQSVEGLCQVIQQVVKNQQETAVSLQQLLSGISDKLERFNIQLQLMQEKLAALEHRMMKNDIREQNRRLRTHDAFSFQAQKTANP